MRLDFESDGGAAARKSFGLVVLQSDETMEPELRGVFTAPGTALYHARIPNAPEVTPETLAAMEEGLPRTAALLPRADVIGYGCTSASTIIGADRVAAAVHKAQPEAKVTEPISATLAACAHLGVSRLGFITPYIPEVSARMRSVLEANGLEIPVFGSFEQIADHVVARITEASTLNAIRRIAGEAQVDAIFVSCTSVRGFGIIEQAEAETGVPVITSNSALGWHMLTLAGEPTRGKGPGRLYG